MSVRTRLRGSALWRLLLALAVAGLAGLAFWVWGGSGHSKPASEPEPSEPTTDPLAPLEALLEAELFDDARVAAKRLGRAHPEALGPFLERLERRERAFRSRLQPVEFRVELLETSDALGERAVFAEWGDGERVRWISEALVDNFAEAGPERCANRVTLRTTLDSGMELRLLDEGGLLREPEPLTPALELGPLEGDRSGQFEFRDPDGSVRLLRVAWELDERRPGLQVTGRKEGPGKGVGAQVDYPTWVLGALEAHDVVVAESWLRRLRSEAPEHPERGFLEQEVRSAREQLARSSTEVQLCVLEAAFDPLGGDRPWYRAGQAHALEGRWLREDAEPVDGDGRLVAFPIDRCDAPLPNGNEFRFSARGDAALVFELRDTSPTFSSPLIGSVRLPLRLMDLPDGSGQLVVAREPAVGVLPPEDTNRMRRLIVRWHVQR